MFDIKYGGRNRVTKPANPSGSWEQGQVLMLEDDGSDDGRWTNYDGAADVVLVLATEDYNTSTDDVTPRDSNSSGLFPNAYVEGDVIADGITFALNEKIYADASGFWTNDNTYGNSKSIGQVDKLLSGGGIGFLFVVDRV